MAENMTENMAETEKRDRITVEDEQGNAKEYAVEALFDMDEESYALLKSEDALVLMQVIDGDEEDEQYLVSIDDAEKATAILDAYQVAVDAAPAQ